MKTGMVLYSTEGKADVPLQTVADLVATAASLGVTAVSVANSEDDAVYEYINLINGGMERVLFMRVAYDPALDGFEFAEVTL